MSQPYDKNNLALGYLRMAYKDYIAARVLLNKDYTLQGAILASTAIEKYFKAIISLHSDKKIQIHIYKFEIIRTIINEIGYGLLIEKIDPLFLELLAKAYKFRYYDNITEPTTIGFFKNQFLGELDGTVELFERLFKLSKDDDIPILSPLKQDYQMKNPDLLENNWVTMKIDKKKFMETDCIGFAVHIIPENVFEEINVSSVKMTVPYNGSMLLISIANGKKSG